MALAAILRDLFNSPVQNTASVFFGDWGGASFHRWFLPSLLRLQNF